MEKQEVIMKVLERSGCQTSKQISALSKRWYNFDISASSASGILKSLEAKGVVGSSNCGYGATVYWLNENIQKGEKR